MKMKSIKASSKSQLTLWSQFNDTEKIASRPSKLDTERAKIAGDSLVPEEYGALKRHLRARITFKL
jgi:hypothetical protein